MSEKIIEVEFTIAYVGFGGNAGQGEYFYSVRPDMVTVGKGQSPVTIAYKFADHMDDHFKFVTVLSTDANGQISDVQVKSQGREVQMCNANTVKSLILLSVLVKDDKRNRYINCDPQMGNDPEIDLIQG
ncbi:MAG: hypothetical protein ACK5PG_14540 [Lysobacterales bacterium]|jgi:hypothetical protein